VGGGHLKLIPFNHPPDEHQAAPFFPSYHLAKFEMSAARIRLLAEQRGSCSYNSPHHLRGARVCMWTILPNLRRRGFAR
jgi:hypothetical protein